MATSLEQSSNVLNALNSHIVKIAFHTLAGDYRCIERGTRNTTHIPEANWPENDPTATCTPAYPTEGKLPGDIAIEIFDLDNGCWKTMILKQMLYIEKVS